MIDCSSQNLPLLSMNLSFFFFQQMQQIHGDDSQIISLLQHHLLQFKLKAYFFLSQIYSWIPSHHLKLNVAETAPDLSNQAFFTTSFCFVWKILPIHQTCRFLTCVIPLSLCRSSHSGCLMWKEYSKLSFKIYIILHPFTQIRLPPPDFHYLTCQEILFNYLNKCNFVSFVSIQNDVAKNILEAHYFDLVNNFFSKSLSPPVYHMRYKLFTFTFKGFHTPFLSYLYISYRNVR